MTPATPALIMQRSKLSTSELSCRHTRAGKQSSNSYCGIDEERVAV